MVEAVGLERNKKNYASLDVLKLIMALIVVARHIGGDCPKTKMNVHRN